MSSMNVKVSDFLHRHGMHYDTIDMDIERERLIQAMRDGLAGRPSSLMMIPTYITLAGRIENDKEVLVLDAGGTNFRIATAKRQPDGTISIANFKKHPMPGTRGQITVEQFFEEVADIIEPVLDASGADCAGFCFSFAVSIRPDGEGELWRFSKEVDVTGTNGQLIGQSINAVLERRGKRRLRFILLNDTVAAMLSGVLQDEERYSGYIGYILGTGTNTCYMESCAKITKVPEITFLPGRMAINMESGIYAGFTLGEFDAELDRESQIPGDHLMEKMMGGVYQGKVIYKTVRRAAEESLFSEAFKAALAGFDTFAMEQISFFSADTRGNNQLAALCGDDDADRQTLFEIIDASFERAGRLAAILFAATIEQSGVIASEERPVCITAEGTTFAKATLFRPKLDRYMVEYVTGKRGLHCEIISVADSTLIGAACAAMLPVGGGA